MLIITIDLKIRILISVGWMYRNFMKRKTWFAKTLRQAQGKQPAQIFIRFTLKIWRSAYIFLLYWPPTSNKALVICPKEQTLQTSIKASKIFLL